MVELDQSGKLAAPPHDIPTHIMVEINNYKNSANLKADILRAGNFHDTYTIPAHDYIIQPSGVLNTRKNFICLAKKKKIISPVTSSSYKLLI